MFAANAVGASSSVTYVEDVFSTYLYTGNGSTQTITNGIDLANKGGLVWLKNRSGAPGVPDHCLFDSARGAPSGGVIRTNLTNAAVTNYGPTSFNSNGFTLDSDPGTNENTIPYVSWSFRKAPKFFDVVTWTGTGGGRWLSHGLGTAPGFFTAKILQTTGNWLCYHRSIGATGGLMLNSTLNVTDTNFTWDNEPTSTQFYVPAGLNSAGQTYVAYLFAHDTSAEGIIQCGSFTTDASGNATVSLGWEPQFLLVKRSDSTSGWFMWDTSRAWPAPGGGVANFLYANTSGAEVANGSSNGGPNATGFTSGAGWANGPATYIYLAIRRGPMKAPTSGTQVYNAITSSASVGTAQSTGFPIDLQIVSPRGVGAKVFSDRLRGVVTTNSTTATSPMLQSESTSAESSGIVTNYWNNNGFQIPNDAAGINHIYWNFRRYPGVFDIVCYKGNGTTQSVSHNLTVPPELIIVRNRTTAGVQWPVYSSAIDKTLYLNTTMAAIVNGSEPYYVGTTVSASSFTVSADGSADQSNGATSNYVAYLFATKAGISKVGSYTGNGTSQTIDCGFAAGARFVIIKKTSSTGNWWLFDSTRGIVAGTEGSLSLNTTNAETSGYDAIDPTASGFVINEDAHSLNATGATYIYLALS